MKKLTKKSQLIFYALGGLGVNMLNLMMGSYLCRAIIASGFSAEAAKTHTFQNTDLVIVAVWAVFGVIAKVIDGIIDIPMAAFADNLKSRFGRRRPALLIGLIPTIAAYLLFLIVPNNGQATLLNTIYLGVVLCLFYIAYTLTMVTYYATFTEIVDNVKARNMISNVKSFFDVLYYIFGYVGVVAMLKGLNIRIVALLVLPMALTMLIPFFMIKEPDNREDKGEKVKALNLATSLKYTLKNKKFIVWMIVYSCMTFGVQLFLSGINEYFTGTGMNMMFVMMGSFAPVPLTLYIYTKIFNKYGFGFAFRYAVLSYSFGMLSMFGVSFIAAGIARTILAILSGVFCSLAIGALFSVAYSIPAQLAAEEQEKTGVSNSAMYFAVQGLFAGIASAIGSYVVLNILKSITGVIEDPFTVNPMYFVTLICAAATFVSFLLTFKLPKSLVNLGKADNND